VSIRIWVLAGYLVGVNVVTFAMYAWDKRAAVRGRRRIPERSLLAIALIGGSPAALVARRVLRHKTSKLSFRVSFALVVVIQLTAFGLAIYWFQRS
jgi:uncharacterized membrane protein YsdA (DUF1294 family)